MFQAKTTNEQAKMFGGKVNHGNFDTSITKVIAHVDLPNCI